MDDWQDAAFSSRHMHNRVGRSGGKGGVRSKPFDVRKTFGSYECKCAAWQKISSATAADDDRDLCVELEVYRLTANGQGVVGEISFPGVLRGSVILAASRKSLQGILDTLDAVDDEDEEEEEEESGGESDEEELESSRFDTFEKNSFRSPKFWFRWSGVPTAGQKSENVESGLGYVVFSGNDCRKFKGTINCASLGWKDVSLTGHKTVSRSESDIPVTWGESEVAL
ncbi:hypothetical protein P153DRAFT_392533 [Dothidotthia symphoricarpi CBS 119687]|uniref:Catalase n=1 Tax=Dothidotthia symphoricarpi CBS 119687 TaxID=1392245 RepID=A0A6A6APR1_9PLEO|nr:uncharacterized protein P153DRAFT_392533 [Dothidotthia symphoricarpi CBS 119687]KAF2133909.1 hypothetical protein P153DRAFT_392533 [Dothidotthia symphoricarpi CBS 119687]